VLGLNVVALFNEGCLSDWVRLCDALLAGGSGALLVGHLLDNIPADLFGHGVADLLRHCVAYLFRHGVADLVGHRVADIVVFCLVLGLGEGVAHPLFDGGALLGGGDVIDCPADGM